MASDPQSQPRCLLSNVTALGNRFAHSLVYHNALCCNDLQPAAAGLPHR